MNTCTGNCTSPSTTTNTSACRPCRATPHSSMPFLIAMLAVVGVGGACYSYFDATVFSPVDAQEQTALNNPGVGHPPRNKRPAASSRTESATTRSEANTNDRN